MVVRRTNHGGVTCCLLLAYSGTSPVHNAAEGFVQVLLDAGLAKGHTVSKSPYRNKPEEPEETFQQDPGQQQENDSSRSLKAA